MGSCYVYSSLTASSSDSQGTALQELSQREFAVSRHRLLRRRVYRHLPPPRGSYLAIQSNRLKRYVFRAVLLAVPVAGMEGAIRARKALVPGNPLAETAFSGFCGLRARRSSRTTVSNTGE